MSKLGKVTKGPLDEAIMVLIYGAEGVGKSTLAADMESPIWFDIENGSGALDVARYPFRDDAKGHVPHTYGDVVDAIDDLRNSEHDYKTLVIDTIDAFEPLIWAHVVAEHTETKNSVNKTGKKLDVVEDIPYMRGLNVAVDYWRDLLVRLDDLRVYRGMNIALLGHCHIKNHKPPTSEPYDRISLRVNKLAGPVILGHCQVVGYLAYEEGAKAIENTERFRGWDTGVREIHFKRSAAYDAKKRWPIPDRFQVSAAHPWQPIAKAIKVARSATPEHYRLLIAAEVKRLGDEDLKHKVADAVAQAGDNTAALAEYLKRLQAREPAQAKEAA